MSGPRNDGELPGLYDDTRTLRITGSINGEVDVALGDEPVFFTWAADLLAAAQRAAYEAGLALQPVVDREAVESRLTDALIVADGLVAPGYSARIEADADDIARVLAPAVLALLNGGAS
jgi:hypothetical protein